MLNGEIAHLDKFELMGSKCVDRKIIEMLSKQYPWIRKHRARVIEKEPDCYYFLQDPPNVKKYITESDDQKDLEISIKESGIYYTNIDDLIDWLEGDYHMDENNQNKTYENVVIKDSTKYYYTKLDDLVYYQIGNHLPCINMTDCYENYHQTSLSTLFSLISKKLKPSSVEWMGPIVPIDLFVDGFPLIKQLTISFPILQEDVTKLYRFTCLEEFSSLIPPSQMLEKEYLYLKMNMVGYTFNYRDGIQRSSVLGEFLF
jgi:hypothetical protein